MMKMKLLFICLGNICRSPAAEGIMRQMLEERALSNDIIVDSAGIGSWHVGEMPDLVCASMPPYAAMTCRLCVLVSFVLTISKNSIISS